MAWSGPDQWWRGELAGDPTYETVVTPALIEVLDPQPGRLYGEIGSGEGRVMRQLRSLGAEVVGVDISPGLAAEAGPQSMVAEVPPIPLRDECLDGIYLVLVLEHIADHAGVLADAARVVRPGGTLALVMNHPVWTAPGSTPIEDSDGEILWRPGDYFSDGSSDMPAGEGKVTFHHRTMASLLNAAASAGWALERIEERPHQDLEGQEGIPRLLACRWRLLP